nr:lysine-rich arabinogalactan protein 19-like [Penaeus vannamei]
MHIHVHIGPQRQAGAAPPGRVRLLPPSASAPARVTTPAPLTPLHRTATIPSVGVMTLARSPAHHPPCLTPPLAPPPPNPGVLTVPSGGEPVSADPSTRARSALPLAGSCWLGGAAVVRLQC